MKSLEAPITSPRFISRYEKLPAGVMDSVHINSDLVDRSSDPAVRRFSDPEYVKEKAGFFTLGKGVLFTKDPQQVKVQPPDSHRGFALRFSTGLFDEYGTAYGQVHVKGVGISRRSIRKVRSHRPAGLFAQAHGELDMRVSNVFAEHGGRTARGIAVITLNHEKLLEWAEQELGAKKGHKYHTYNLSDNIKIIEDHGNTSALLVRLVGADRWAEFNKERRVQPELPRKITSHSPYRWGEMQNRTLQVIKSEVGQGTSAFQEKYAIPDAILESLKRVLGNNQRSDGEIGNALAALNLHFFNFNRGVKSVVSREYFKGKLEIDMHEGNQDYAGFWVDWENALPESGQYQEEKEYKAYARGYERRARLIQTLGENWEDFEHEAYQAGKERAKTILHSRLPEEF